MQRHACARACSSIVHICPPQHVLALCSKSPWMPNSKPLMLPSKVGIQNGDGCIAIYNQALFCLTCFPLKIYLFFAFKCDRCGGCGAWRGRNASTQIAVTAISEPVAENEANDFFVPPSSHRKQLIVPCYNDTEHTTPHAERSLKTWQHRQHCGYGRSVSWSCDAWWRDALPFTGCVASSMRPIGRLCHLVF